MFNRNNASRSTSRRTVRGSGKKSKATIPMICEKVLRAGVYRSKIVKVANKKTIAGEDAIEVVYAFTGADGKEITAREVLPVESYFFERFCDALIAAGLKDGDDLADAVGIEEDVEIDYPVPHGLGRLKLRCPVRGEKFGPTLEDVEAEDERPEAGDDFDDFFEDTSSD